MKERVENKSSARTEAAEMLSHKGAIALAKRLESYWHIRGYVTAHFWAEPIEERFDKVGSYELYRVASNLINGLPPRYRDWDPASALVEVKGRCSPKVKADR